MRQHDTRQECRTPAPDANNAATLDIPHSIESQSQQDMHSQHPQEQLEAGQPGDRPSADQRPVGLDAITVVPISGGRRLRFKQTVLLGATTRPPNLG